MKQDLEQLCAARERLFAEIEDLERSGGDPEALRLARARLAQLLHQINDADGVPDLPKTSA